LGLRSESSSFSIPSGCQFGAPFILAQDIPPLPNRHQRRHLLHCQCQNHRYRDWLEDLVAFPDVRFHHSDYKIAQEFLIMQPCQFVLKKNPRENQPNGIRNACLSRYAGSYNLENAQRAGKRTKVFYYNPPTHNCCNFAEEALQACGLAHFLFGEKQRPGQQNRPLGTIKTARVSDETIRMLSPGIWRGM
jgi:hypothetical protein